MTASQPIQRVVLVGLRGSGKTAVGRALASRLGWQFCDTDEEIQRQAGRTIREIFEQDGEPAFRVLETTAVTNAIQKTSVVISTGGGAVLSPENQARFRTAGTRTIWLDALNERLAQRIGNDADSHAQRPRLTSAESALAEVAMLRAQREAMYERVSHARIDTSALAPEQAAEIIVQMMASQSVDLRDRGRNAHRL